MNVRVAGESGFCFGVRKAIERVKDIKDKSNVFVAGKLIHNPQVIGSLEREGVRFVDSIEGVGDGILVVSAHGLPDNVIEKAREQGLEIIDTTCPLVKNVHNITKDLERQGARIIIFGDKNHTEVKGIVGNLTNPIVISDISEIKDIPDGNYALVSQTTQEIGNFNLIGNELKKSFPDSLVSDTICSATKLRQRSAEELAHMSELMIVIGGKDSANTKRLALICSRITDTKQIERIEDVQREWFLGKTNIGVSAGASTPQEVIKDIVEYIKRITS
ncbi:MAG TPA: 4-hydroxy-3-methylbut-2-enyl diphosphate reductase [Candidatus Nanoarchaeia archaeon]|nr:4-hydroxy-3-methylbut-2-enyl diphosphate reductase [Candidatus Nanoarchaeia archaeon]